MNPSIRQIDENLDIIISEKTKCNYSVAGKWQWRVLNEYPEELKNLVRCWAKEEPLPAVEYCEVSLEDIINYTELDFMDAVDLLYILSRDPAAGGSIYAHSLRRDLNRGR